MTPQKPLVPNEFLLFVRDVGVRAFDALAARIASSSDARETPFQKMGGYWLGLEAPQKSYFFDQLIIAAQMAAATAPLAMLRKSKKAKEEKTEKKAPKKAKTRESKKNDGKKSDKKSGKKKKK